MEACQETSVVCLKCGSEYVVQIHRLCVEKWITTKCKYQCTDCGKKFYIQKPKALPQAQEASPPSESFFHFFRS